MLKRPLLVPQKLGLKLLEMGKDTMIKLSVSSAPPKVWGDFFLKKALKEGTNFFGQTYGGGGDVLHES